MTAFSQILTIGTPRTRGNKKDGATGRKPRNRAEQFEAVGFTLVEPPSKWSYTWQGIFPVFQVKPGVINGLGGIVARCDQANVTEWFPYGTKPGTIKSRLDDLILDILRQDAETADIHPGPGWDEWLLDFDGWMSAPDPITIDIDLNDCLMANMENICVASGGKLHPSDFTQWDTPGLGEKLDMPDQDFLDWAYNNPGLQQLAQPNPGASEAVQALREAGYRVRIVTSTCMTYEQIQAWLDQHEITVDEIVKTQEKLSKNLLIDDNEWTLRKREALGLPSLRFERPWNSNCDCPGFGNWSQAVEMIKEAVNV